MKKTILVTGCAGFIGSNFVAGFKKQFPKTTIVGIDDFSGGRRDAVDSGIVFYEGSITDTKLVDSIFAKHKPEFVFHFAALPRVSYTVAHPRESAEVNVLGTVALLEASKKYSVKRFIFSSSCIVYGDAKKLPTDEKEIISDLRSPYAIQKYASELFCRQFSEFYGLDTVCLRYFNAYGEGQYGDSPYCTVVAAWLESMYFPKNKKGFIEGTGVNSRDLVHVSDVVQANILAMQSQKDLKGEVFNIASGQKISVKEVRALIEKFTGQKLSLERRPPRPKDVRHTLADISKAKKMLGYKPNVSFEKGLKDTIMWFESRKK